VVARGVYFGGPPIGLSCRRPRTIAGNLPYRQEVVSRPIHDVRRAGAPYSPPPLGRPLFAPPGRPFSYASAVARLAGPPGCYGGQVAAPLFPPLFPAPRYQPRSSRAACGTESVPPPFASFPLKLCLKRRTGCVTATRGRFLERTRSRFKIRSAAQPSLCQAVPRVPTLAIPSHAGHSPALIGMSVKFFDRVHT
jgi:hypothetical protein